MLLRRTRTERLIYFLGLDVHEGRLPTKPNLNIIVYSNLNRYIRRATYMELVCGYAKGSYCSRANTKHKNAVSEEQVDILCHRAVNEAITVVTHGQIRN